MDNEKGKKGKKINKNNLLYNIVFIFINNLIIYLEDNCG